MKKTNLYAHKALFFLLIFALGISSSISLHAQKYKPLYTYYNFSFGAKAMGMGNAFTAVADDLTAVFWNPAGMAEFKLPQVYINYRKDKMDYNYDLQEIQAGSTTQKYTSTFNSNLKNIDFASISVPAYFWQMKWNFALSYYRLIPYSMKGSNTTKYSSMTGVDTTNEITDETLMTFDGDNGIDVLAFTAAYYYSDYFSFGITLQQFLNSGTVNYDYQSSTHQYQLSNTEKFSGRNLILGFIFKPMEDVVMGMSYRFKLSNSFSSEYTLKDSNGTSANSTKSDAILPSRLSFGLVVDPFHFMRVSADYSIIYWKNGEVSNYYDNNTTIEYPVRDAFTFSQKDAVNFRLGVEFKIPFNHFKLFLRGGMFTENPLFVDSSSNGLKIKGVSLGFGIRILGVADLNIAYMKQNADWTEAAYFDNTNTISTHYDNKILSMSVTFRFGRTR